MPQVLRFGSYRIYFWSNEGRPLEPIHVHITNGIPDKNGTKIWITQKGKALKANPNDKKIPEQILNRLIQMIEAQSEYIISEWKERFGEISYYC